MRNKIPNTLTERKELRESIAKYATEKQIVPPVAMHTLRSLVNEFVTKNRVNEEFSDWLMVELHNAIWSSIVSSIPRDRLLLLVPKCLSHSQKCKGEIDELGLLCHRCGNCVIPTLEDRAAELGVLSMVAEGFTSVIELIENHAIDAVIGVSCLDSLEKAFPLLVSHAVPGLAVSLNFDGCKDTQVDSNYVISLLSKHSDQTISITDYNRTKDCLDEIFDTEKLKEIWNPSEDETNRIAFSCLSDGKRWRPFILAAVYHALTGDNDIPMEVRKAAIAIECFHKASLVHDDIQDKEVARYGKPTVNAYYGVDTAINIGDLLLGQGYKILSGCKHTDLTGIIADAHVRLCKGQGMELLCNGEYTNQPLDFVLDVHANKTAPAFEAALLSGLICAGFADSPMRKNLIEYSKALGIAYQISDDIADFAEDNIDPRRPSIVKAIQTMHPEWDKDMAISEAICLKEKYHENALDAIGGLDNFELRRLLFQVTEKVLK